MRTVIVGAGAAGAVIAARMTEGSAHEVLLVEAGPDYPPDRELPFDLKDGRKNSMLAHDWGFRHRPSTSMGSMGLRFPFPRGKVVGGSSAVNTCIALRGQPYDYDEWGALGLRDWSWEKCLPAFKRLERDLDFGDREVHGDRGPLPIRRHTAEELVPWQAAFLAACKAIGYPDAPDSNDGRPDGGAGPHAMNKVDGQRVSAARAYLTEAVRARPNLTILASTLVRRVLFKNRRITGIEVDTRGHVRVITADRVVLCAGAILTPAILIRSGIGPRDLLERLGVDVVADNPAVGARLLDHPGAAFFFRPRHRGIVSVEDPLIQTVCRFTSEGSACPSDIQLQPGSIVPIPRTVFAGVSLATCLGKPRGHGRLVFTSAHPNDKPRIESRLFEDTTDRRTTARSIERLLELADTKALRELATIVYPREKTLRELAKDDRALHSMCDSGYHPCGTVPMGADGAKAEDAATCGRGRVRGVSGLLVADASLMPTIPSSNTHLPTLMIGERFGEWLRDGTIDT